ncbi:MAG TPA: hypothetical protein VLL72_03210 [Kiloniellales bacterium]|nr:hypothetical protein [Kiloniellales bacterium]
MKVDELKYADSVRDFMTSRLGFDPEEYDFDYEGIDAVSGWEIVRARHADDRKESGELVPGTGSGKSRTLYLDPSSGEVKQALEWP